jgi:L-fucose isomerase-like protein
MNFVIGLVSLAGEYEVGFNETPALLKSAWENLTKAGYTVEKSDHVMYNAASMKAAAMDLKDKEFDVLCVCVGTWSEDHHLLDLLEYINKPVILWAFPSVDKGSLCGVHQICCVLKELNREYFYVYGTTDDSKVIEEIGRVSRSAALKNRLSHVKIGNIGGRVKGMTEIAFDELEIKDKTGVRIVSLDEGELVEAFNNTDEKKAEIYWEELKTKAGKVTAAEKHGVESVRYYFAMKNLIKAYDLEGLVVKCYPSWMGKICLGYSILSEEGIVCGCEGDVTNTVSMKILYELTGKPTHNTDLLYPDHERNTILFSHCGSGAFSIAEKKEDINLGPVRLADTGVCSLFPAKTGKVTLINLVGRRGTFRMTVITGEAVECGMEFPGNPLKVKFQRDVDEINRMIAQEGIGHHWIGGYGDVTRELEYFCRLKNIRLIKL